MNQKRKQIVYQVVSWRIGNKLETIKTCSLRQGKARKSGLTRDWEIWIKASEVSRKPVQRPAVSITGFLCIATITQYSGRHKQDAERRSYPSFKEQVILKILYIEPKHF